MKDTVAGLYDRLLELKTNKVFNNRISKICIFWKRACLWMTAVIHMGESTSNAVCWKISDTFGFIMDFFYGQCISLHDSCCTCCYLTACWCWTSKDQKLQFQDCFDNTFV